MAGPARTQDELDEQMRGHAAGKGPAVAKGALFLANRDLASPTSCVCVCVCVCVCGVCVVCVSACESVAENEEVVIRVAEPQLSWPVFAEVPAHFFSARVAAASQTFFRFLPESADRKTPTQQTRCPLPHTHTFTALPLPRHDVYGEVQCRAEISQQCFHLEHVAETLIDICVMSRIGRREVVAARGASSALSIISVFPFPHFPYLLSPSPSPVLHLSVARRPPVQSFTAYSF
jgi:hypothetical protein